MITAYEIEVNVVVKGTVVPLSCSTVQLVDRGLNEWWVKYNRDLSG
jgi:hypothetical protein